MARAEQAAAKFFRRLFPNTNFDFTDHPAKSLIVGAYALYERAWQGTGQDIRHWKYPMLVLDQGGTFDGDEPWAVLLRRAMELSEADADVHTVVGKRRFCRELSNTIMTDVIGNIPKMPQEWDGHELRRLLADKFMNSISPVMRSGHRLREYQNELLVQNLL